MLCVVFLVWVDVGVCGPGWQRPFQPSMKVADGSDEVGGLGANAPEDGLSG